MKNNILFLISIILLSLITLSGCSTILTVIGGMTFINTAFNDSRTIGTQLDDNILKIYIFRALHNHNEIYQFTRIKSTIYQGNVLLTGQSPSHKLTQQATKIVMNINGVKNIYNAIRQEPPISFQSILTDAWISNQIRLSFFIQKNQNISRIKVISENKEIFLLGKVTNTEGLCAIKIAKDIKGIKNVFTIFTYI